MDVRIALHGTPFYRSDAAPSTLASHTLKKDYRETTNHIMWQFITLQFVACVNQYAAYLEERNFHQREEHLHAR
ncbi:hypothetical protein COCC4DRAFT_59951 [Bipolaris maydis ATCC 48331]|uniref:Uncharacterized protein n=2 Tax=Cochliobolus heterostrophus TaxID=5016 RepID=M2SMH5_COCH5|nr:uncharacterized protein COCC4DRAFT_59951 [Bipolaris maydis ATCC 48331]EMD86535.1 hypothetical protein COCHEDRAFT_1218733 [Bipolaris maydis C5]ENI06483.1 hypothetical protein COCC4DRAFT_59951 [Bipolaris maydis ATCC 48331]